MPNKKNWLQKVIENARREYETIPEWKRQRMREYLNYEPAGPRYRWEDAHPGGLK